jgi:hypothetical protein
MRRILALAALPLSVYAQSPLGTVTGFALDPSGAPVPNAKVVLKNNGTGVSVEAATNPSCNYLLPNLTPGSYSLTAEAEGFRHLQLEPFPPAAFRPSRQDLRFQHASPSAQYRSERRRGRRHHQLARASPRRFFAAGSIDFGVVVLRKG